MQEELLDDRFRRACDAAPSAEADVVGSPKEILRPFQGLRMTVLRQGLRMTNMGK